MITIKDQWQDVFPEHVNQTEYETYEVPRKDILDEDTIIVTQKTIGPHYLDMMLTHNGYKPGDSGNGGYIQLEIDTDYMWNNYDDPDNSIKVKNTKSGFILTATGEWERLQLVKVLQTALDELKEIKPK